MAPEFTVGRALYAAARSTPDAERHVVQELALQRQKPHPGTLQQLLHRLEVP